MKYTFLGFSTKHLYELELDQLDAMLLRHFADFKDAPSPKIKRKLIDGEIYVWISYQKFLDEYPFVKSEKAGKQYQKDTIYRRYKKLCDKHVLKHKTITENGTYSYFAFGERYYELVSDSSDNLPPKVSESIPTPSESIPTPSESIPTPLGIDSDPLGIDSGAKINLPDPSTKNPSTTSSSPSTTPAKSAQPVHDDGDGGAINTIFSDSKREERLTPSQIKMICTYHDLDSPEEITKAVRYLATQNFIFAGTRIQNMTGFLIGPKDGNGGHESSCFFGGTCIFPDPEPEPIITTKPQPELFMPHVQINWKAKFDALPEAQQAAFRSQAEAKIGLDRLQRMKPKAAAETLTLAMLSIFQEQEEDTTS